MQTKSKNWNDLENIIDVHELTNKDEQCLNDLQAVIEKYGLTNKFGVSLLHKHFDIADDEVLLERNNPKERTLTSSPIKIEEAEKPEYMTTMWRFDDGHRYRCSYCNRNHCD